MLNLLVVLVCCLTVVASLQIEFKDFGSEAPRPPRSCDLRHGTVCIPSACSNATCDILPDAECITDRCGCEARFFHFTNDAKVFRDFTKMCRASTAALNFVQFLEAENLSPLAQMDEAPSSVLKFFHNFNVLMGEILEDVAQHLTFVTVHGPNEKNIKKLEAVLHRLRQLQIKDRRRVFSDEYLVAHSDEGKGIQENKLLPKFPIITKKNLLKVGRVAFETLKAVGGAGSETLGQADPETVIEMAGSLVWSNPRSREIMEKIFALVRALSKGIQGQTTTMKPSTMMSTTMTPVEASTTVQPEETKATTKIPKGKDSRKTTKKQVTVTTTMEPEGSSTEASTTTSAAKEETQVTTELAAEVQGGEATTPLA